MSDNFAPGVFFGLALGLLVSAFMWTTTKNYYRNSAIEAGVAKWSINEKTGETTFRYFNPPDDMTGKITAEEIEGRAR